MNAYLEIQTGLQDRRRSLDRRIRELDDLPRGPAPSNAEIEDLVQSSREQLGCVDASLKRIADRTFDICIHCGSQIDRSLLETQPFTASCEECTRSYRWDYLGRVSAQHDDLEAMVHASEASVTALCEASRAGSAVEQRRRVVHTVLRLLRCELDEHFAFEEAAGSLDAAVEAAPRLTREAERLRREHADLLSHLDSIVELAGTPELPTAQCETLAARFAVLRDTFLDHERAENEIIAGAFLDDLGGGD